MNRTKMTAIQVNRQHHTKANMLDYARQQLRNRNSRLNSGV